MNEENKTQTNITNEKSIAMNVNKQTNEKYTRTITAAAAAAV